MNDARQTVDSRRPFPVHWFVAPAAMMLVAALYFGSAGPMTPVLRYHSGEWGGRLWDRAYGEPLAALPRSARRLANRYIAWSERTYWRWRDPDTSR